MEDISSNINSITRKYNSYVNETEKKKSVRTSDTSPSAAGKGKDTVTISGVSKDLQLAKQAIDDLPEIRAQEVNSLQNQINNGSYQINPDAVADQILNTHSAKISG